MRLTLHRGFSSVATAMLAGLMLLLYSVAASAAPMDTNIIDSVLTKYQAAATAWGSVMVNYASWLFWGLALISMVWTFGMMALRNAGIQEALAEMVRFLAVLGFFWWILSNGPAIAGSIVKSMWMIGAEAIGQTTDFMPGDVVQIGFNIFFKALDQALVWSPIDNACGILIATLILAILTLVGVNLLLLFVSAWVLIYGGVFFLGFGGGRWTTDIAINYYKTVLSIGGQIMVMLLLIGIGKSFVDQYYAGMSAAVNLKELGVMLVVALVLFYLTNKVPPLIGGIVSGGGGSGSTSGFGMAASAAATGGAMAMAGAANMAGSASALKDAFTQAQQRMSEGSGMLSGNGSINPAGGSGGFMSATNIAGHFATNMGTQAVVKGNDVNMMDSGKAPGSLATGGRVASEINNPGFTHWHNAGQSQSGGSLQPLSSKIGQFQGGEEGFTSDSSGIGKSGNQSALMNEEVADFVNKGKKSASP